MNNPTPTASPAQQAFLIRETRRRRQVVICRAMLLVLLLALWELASSMNWIDGFIFSSPTLIARCLWEMGADGSLFWHTGVTLLETLASFAICTILSLACALALWSSKSAAQILEPFLVLLNSLPKSALAPLLIVWLGNNMRTIITAAVSVSFTVIWIIPHTHTNIGNPAVVFKEFTEIRYIIDHISIEILICHSAVEFRNHRRDVQSHNEIFTEILYLFYIDISLYIPLRIIFPGIRSLSFSYCKRNHRSGQFIAVRLQLSHDIIVPDTRKSHIHLENLSAVVAEHRINQTIFISDCPLIRPPPQVNTFCPKISNLCIPFEYFCRKVNRVSCFRGSIVRRNFNTVHIRSVRFFCHHGKCCHTPDHTQ